MAYKLVKLSHDLQQDQITASLRKEGEGGKPSMITIVTQAVIPPDDKEPGVRKRSLDAVIHELEQALEFIRTL